MEVNALEFFIIFSDLPFTRLSVRLVPSSAVFGGRRSRWPRTGTGQGKEDSLDTFPLLSFYPIIHSAQKTRVIVWDYSPCNYHGLAALLYTYSTCHWDLLTLHFSNIVLIELIAAVLEASVLSFALRKHGWLVSCGVVVTFSGTIVALLMLHLTIATSSSAALGTTWLSLWHTTLFLLFFS